MRLRLAVPLLAALTLLAPVATADAALPPIKHVFIVVLENKAFDESFGPESKATYLSRDLPRQGQLLTQYHGTSHLSLGNYLTMVSGQAPNPETQADCPTYRDVVPGVVGLDGQVMGQGCIYPKAAPTIGDQLEEAGFTWRQYAEDMGQPCRHPAFNSQDETQKARKDDQFATRHVPFLYFRSIIDEPSCADRVVDLSKLQADLADAATTPNYVFITPDLCSDAHDEPCVDGRPGGLVSADDFLKEWVPRIMQSPAWQTDGLLIVTYDESETDGENSTACCNEPTGPNTPQPGIFGPGGGRTGTLLLSPFIPGGTYNETPYNHYSMLRSVEDIFGVPHLGYAGQEGLAPFGDDVYQGGPPTTTTPPPFTQPKPEPKPDPKPKPTQSRRPSVAVSRRTVPGCRRARPRRGRLIAKLVVHGRELVVLPRVRGRLRIAAGRRVLVSRRVRACHAYGIVVPRSAPGRLTVRVRSGRVTQRRTVRR